MWERYTAREREREREGEREAKRERGKNAFLLFPLKWLTSKNYQRISSDTADKRPVLCINTFFALLPVSRSIFNRQIHELFPLSSPFILPLY